MHCANKEIEKLGGDKYADAISKNCQRWSSVYRPVVGKFGGLGSFLKRSAQQRELRAGKGMGAPGGGA